MGRMLRVRVAVVLTSLMNVPQWAHAENAVEAGSRRFTVRDSVQMSYFGNIRSSMPDELDDDGITSPDGRLLIKVTHRGVLPEGYTEGTIWLFDAADAKRSINDPGHETPRPVALAKMSAAANGGLGLSVLEAGNTIISPRWAPDSRSLTFIGRRGRVNRQLFEIDISSRHLVALTPPTQDVITYSGSNTTFLYLAGPDADVQAERAWSSTGPDIPDVTIGTGVPLMPLLYPHFNGYAYGDPLLVELWRVDRGHAAPIIDTRTHQPLRVNTTYDSTLVSASPDNRRAVIISRAAADSEPAYLMVNLDSGLSAALMQSSIRQFQFGGTGRYRASWSPNGALIALTEVMIGDTQSPRRCVLAVLQLSNKDAQCVVEADEHSRNLIQSVNWTTNSSIDVRYKSFNEPVFVDTKVQSRSHRWIESKVKKHSANTPLLLSVRESLNEPPVLVATDLVTGKSRQMLDPNPQLAGVALGTVSVYEWKDPHGRLLKGGLVKPPHFDPTRRYALVIQTHGFDDKKFFRSGYADTASAGRALAGRDIVVLQVREPQAAEEESWRDGVELGTNVYLAAIDRLSAQGIVDANKVGISGYSYSGWLVATSITQAANRFAAAEIANSDPATLTGYYEYVDTPMAETAADAYIGARPYGKGLKLWLERSPSFATDKILAPVLIQAGDPWHLISLWGMYAALRDQGKAVELQYIRSGEHNIRKPAHILAHQELIVDWFDFWLNDHEDQSETKQEQYVRWQAMREAKEASVKPPLH